MTLVATILITLPYQGFRKNMYVLNRPILGMGLMLQHQ